jgi:excisionase family DNA binding protein
MEVITLTSEAFQEIKKSISDIGNKIENINKKQPLSEAWLDIADVCQLLHVSKRTLQSYRDNGTLSFSQIGGKIYFKAADIEEHLNKHYVKAFKK